VFFILKTYNYDVLLGLDLFLNIGAIIDVEKGVIQVHNEPNMEVEVLPFIVVNIYVVPNQEFKYSIQ
jgi:hypothetical protein